MESMGILQTTNVILVTLPVKHVMEDQGSIVAPALLLVLKELITHAALLRPYMLEGLRV
jgi:hypothetical protein